MPRILVGTLLLTLAAGPALAADGGREQALAALDRGDAAAAGAALRLDAAEALYYLALTERGEARQATAERLTALASGLGAWIEPAARGLAAAAAGRLDDAIAGYREATTARADDHRLWKQLGDLLVEKGERGEARRAYLRAIAVAPDYATALIELGDLEREGGDFGAAFNAYNHAVGADGKPVSALLGRAAARLLMGDREGALADLERAASIGERGSERYRALMGVLYVHTYDRQLPLGLDRAEQAVQMWNEMGRADMAAAAANAAGRVLLETGDPDRAETWYRRGGEIIETSTLPVPERTIWKVRELHGLARAAASRRETERAQQLANQARQLMDSDPGNAEHYGWIWPYLVGYLRLAERRYPEAIAELQKSETDRPYIAYLIAEAYARQRERARAREWYQKALAAATGLDPESAVVRPAARLWLDKNR